MLWPCEHIMAWDDQDGWDFTRHFHKCWRTESLRGLYASKVPCFLSTDLEVTTECSPPEAAVRKGRHRVVRITSGNARNRNRPPAEGELVDTFGNLFRQYPIEDEQHLSEPMTGSRAIRGEESQEESCRPMRKRKPGPSSGSTRCGKCGVVGHNRRTCSATIGPSTVLNATQPEESLKGEHLFNQLLGTSHAPPSSLVVSPSHGEMPDYSESSAEEDDLVASPEEREVAQAEGNDQYNIGAISYSQPDIVGGWFGHTQQPEQPDWRPYGLSNFFGVDDVQEHMDPWL
ncbi:unnamed protein product [Calypogeia fissa]